MFSEEPKVGNSLTNVRDLNKVKTVRLCADTSIGGKHFGTKRVFALSEDAQCAHGHVCLFGVQGQILKSKLVVATLKKN